MIRRAGGIEIAWPAVKASELLDKVLKHAANRNQINIFCDNA